MIEVGNLYCFDDNFIENVKINKDLLLVCRVFYFSQDYIYYYYFIVSGQFSNFKKNLF